MIFLEAGQIYLMIEVVTGRLLSDHIRMRTPPIPLPSLTSRWRHLRWGRRKAHPTPSPLGASVDSPSPSPSPSASISDSNWIRYRRACSGSLDRCTSEGWRG